MFGRGRSAVINDNLVSSSLMAEGYEEARSFISKVTDLKRLVIPIS